MELQIRDLVSTTTSLTTTNARLSAEVCGLTKKVTDLKQGLGDHKVDTQNSIPHSLAADWKLVFEFFMRNTKPGTVVGGLLEDSVVANAAGIVNLGNMVGGLVAQNAPGLPSGPSLSSHLAGGQPGSGMATAGSLATLEAQVLDLKARMASKSVTIGDFTFPTLSGTCAWAKANLPSNPDQALICLDVVALLHSIGCDFATVDETRDTMYQNKRAGVSTMALTVASSFHTVLPQIMGRKKGAITGEDSGLVLPCAAKYSEWFDNTTGITTGVRARIEEGVITQSAVYAEAIRELSFTHPVGAAMATKLLERSSTCGTRLIGMMEMMNNEYSGRGGEVQPSES